MVFNSTRRIVTAIVAVVLALTGWVILGQHQRSGPELLQESQRLVREYTPECDGKTMQPGDVCIAYGKNASGLSGTYQELVDRYAATVTVEALRKRDGWWRAGAYALFGVAAVLLLMVGARLGMLARVGAGRRALAASHGWTYESEDKILAVQGAVPGYRVGGPRAAHVVTGTRAGFPFQIYSYSTRAGHELTALRITLPIAVPTMVVRAYLADPFGADTDPAVRALLISRLGVVPQGPAWQAFAADGTTFMRTVAPAASPEAMLATLDEAVATSERLVAAFTEPFTGPGTEGDAEQLRPSGRRIPQEAAAAPAPEPKAWNGRGAPRTPYVFRAALLLIGALVTFGGVRMVSGDWPILGSLVIAFGALLAWAGAAMLVSSWRTLAGRRRLARREGWEFRATDPTLVTRLALPLPEGSLPMAAAVLSGTRSDRESLLFEYSQRAGDRSTAFAVRLPAPVPRMTLSFGQDRRAGSSPEGRAALTDDLVARLDEQRAGAFTAGGEWLVVHHHASLSPSAKATLARFDALAPIAATLTSDVDQRRSAAG